MKHEIISYIYIYLKIFKDIHGLLVYKVETLELTTGSYKLSDFYMGSCGGRGVY